MLAPEYWVDVAEPPPTGPADWDVLDEGIMRHLIPHAQAGVAFLGPVACACGREWRYVLGGDAEEPIWRCLHCGSLFSGAQPLRWD